MTDHHHSHDEKDRPSPFTPSNYETIGSIVESGRIWAEDAINSMHLTKDMTVLDFGAGTGIIGRHLLNTVKKVIFEDISEPMLEQCKIKLENLPKKNYEIFLGQIQDYNGEKVDAIVASLALHHAGNLEDCIKGMFELLKPKGKLGVVEFQLETPEEIQAQGKVINRHGFFPDEFREVLTKNGFINIEVKPAYPCYFTTDEGEKEIHKRFSAFAEKP